MSIASYLVDTLDVPMGPWSRTRRAYRSSKTKTLHSYEYCLRRNARSSSETVCVEVNLEAINATKICSKCGVSLSTGDNTDREYEKLLNFMADDFLAANDAGHLLAGTAPDKNLTRTVGNVRRRHVEAFTRRNRLVTLLQRLDTVCDGLWEPVTEACLARFDAFHETITHGVAAADMLITRRLANDTKFALHLALDHQRRTYKVQRRLLDTPHPTPGVEQLQTAAYAAWEVLRQTTATLTAPPPARICERIYELMRDMIRERGDGGTVAWEFVPRHATLDPSTFNNPRQWATAEAETALRNIVANWNTDFEKDLQTHLARHHEPSEVVYISSYQDGSGEGLTELEGFGKVLQLLPRIGLAQKTLVLSASPLVADWLEKKVHKMYRVGCGDQVNIEAARVALGYLDTMAPERAHQVGLALSA